MRNRNVGKTLCSRVAKETDMDEIVEEFHEVLDLG
jgi:hypothetical protein